MWTIHATYKWTCIFFVSTCNSSSFFWEVICLSMVHINISTALEQYMISLFWLSPVYLFCAVCYVVLHFPLSCMPWLPISATTLPMNRLCRLVIAFVFCPVLQTKWDIQEHPALHECGLHCTLYPWMLAQVGCIWSQGKELIWSVYYTSSFSVRSHVVYALVLFIYIVSCNLFWIKN